MSALNNGGLSESNALARAIAASLADQQRPNKRKAANIAAGGSGGGGAAAAAGHDAREPEAKRRRLNNMGAAATAAAAGAGSSGTLQGRQVAATPVYDIVIPVAQIRASIQAATSFPAVLTQLTADYISPRTEVTVNVNDLFLKVFQAKLFRQELSSQDLMILDLVKDRVTDVDLSHMSITISSVDNEAMPRTCAIYTDVIENSFPNLRRFIMPAGGGYAHSNMAMETVLNNRDDLGNIQRLLTKRPACQVANTTRAAHVNDRTRYIDINVDRREVTERIRR